MKRTTPDIKSHLSIFGWALFFLITLTSCGGGNSGEETQAQINQEKVTDSRLKIGDSWDAKKIDRTFLLERNDFLTARVAENTAKIITLHQTGTGFYLGTFFNTHLIATSAHVLKKIASCNFSTVFIHFPMANKIFTCKQLVGIWADVDFAILGIKSNDSFFETLNPLKLAKNLPSKEEPLITMGFGSERNEDKNLTLKEDRYCTVFSDTGALKRISNQDPRRERNIPSFSVGCDLSPGDSGSAIVSKNNQKVLGVLWSVMTPKSPLITSNTYLDQLLSQTNADVWEDLGLVVPATEIRQSLIRWTNRVEVSFPMRKRRRIVLKLLEN